MFGYQRRLERDLGRWQEAGWLDADGARAIRADVARRGPRFGPAAVLALLGVVLMCFAAIAFVAANWDDLSRLTRLAVLLGALWACYALAGVLAARAMPAFAESAILLGIGVYGAGIMLVGQMYQFDPNPTAALLWWALGALLAAGLLSSKTALAASVLLFASWSVWATFESEAVHWAFLVASAGAAAVTAVLRWPAGYHLLAFALSGWIIALGYLLEGGHKHELVVALGLAIGAAGLLAGDVLERLVGFGRALAGYGLAIAFAGLVALQFIERPSVGELGLLAGLTLLLLVAAVFAGWRSANHTLLWTAYVAFSAELTALYFKTLGTLLDTALFFFIAGALVIALAWLAWWLHERQKPGRERPA